MSYNFLPYHDALAQKIEAACEELLIKIPQLPIDEMPFEPFFKWYFQHCHLSRPRFSLRTSARLLHQALSSVNKPLEQVILMDYGAGLGTMYIIAKMIGVGKVIYNDLLPEFATPAIAVDKALGYVMHEYIIGDTKATCEQLKEKNIEVDIILSRNVLEHIYDLKEFFATIHHYQPKAVLFNSTTANWNNPAAHLQHRWIHYKAKKTLAKPREAHIAALAPELSAAEVSNLNSKISNYGGPQLDNLVLEYARTKKLPPLKNDYDNVCEANGNWCEHMIPFKDYKAAAPNYELSFKAGFWDEDYPNPLKRLVGRSLNLLTKVLGSRGYLSSAFIYIIAKPK
jgi:2-polyprenyl-3-methyl-5-hydroxy-6-metoxy-1,4-benzoquinol methylase